MIEFKKIDDQGREMICYRTDDYLTLPELMQEIRCFLLAMGYQPKTVDEHIEAD